MAMSRPAPIWLAKKTTITNSALVNGSCLKNGRFAGACGAFILLIWSKVTGELGLRFFLNNILEEPTDIDNRDHDEQQHQDRETGAMDTFFSLLLKFFTPRAV